MIGPIETPETGSGVPSNLSEAVRAFFKPGGYLAGHCSALDRVYEDRPQQLAMAEAVGLAFSKSHHLCVEAGTGVGKSFAYLIPAILAARESKKKAVVSTYTIALQEQLMSKDVPFLEESLGGGFKAVLVKGQGNYCCRRRLQFALAQGRSLFDAGEFEELERIEAWAETTKDGSLQDLSRRPSFDVWSQVCAEDGICSGRGNHKDCFFAHARREMQDADLLVVNHHLFFSDLAIRSAGGGLFPEYAFAVLDEAHQIEGVASTHMGIRLSQIGFERWMKRLYIAENNKGILSKLKDGDLAHQVTGLRTQVEKLFLNLNQVGKLNDDNPQCVLQEPVPIDSSVPGRIRRLAAGLRDLAEQQEDADLRSELQMLFRRGEALLEELAAWLHQTLQGQVYWLQWEGRQRRQIVMYAAPVDVGPILQARLFETTPSVICTSATLSISGDLSYYQNRVGAQSAETLMAGSPFQYEQQMRVYVPLNLPEPSERPEYFMHAAKAMKFFLRKTDGHAFILFTSTRHMRKSADLLRSFCAEQGYPMLVQGEGLSRHQMLESFRKRPHSVLLGLDSFWMGVDVPGDALTNVMIARLPFAVPDQPLVKARCDRIKENGGDAFREFSLPEAILKFRQGVGRLIRSKTDEGIVVILDRRIVTKHYGRFFINALPDCPFEEVEIT